MAVAQRQASPTPSPQHLQCDSQALIALAVQITMAVAHRHFRAAAITMRFRTSENPCCGNQNGSSAQRHFANIRAAATTMRFRTSENPCCANHNGSSAQTHFANMRAAAITMRFAGNENRCYANHNGSSAHNRGGAQRQLRAPQPLLEALETAPATVESWGGPAATLRAAAPSRGSGDCARHCGELGGPAATPRAAARSGGSADCARHCGELRTLAVEITMAVARRDILQTSAPQPLQCDSEPVRTLALQITMAVARKHTLPTCVPQPLQCNSQAMRTVAMQITMAVARTTAGGPSGDSARRSPFYRLWRLRPPLWRAGGAQRRLRAPQPHLEALETAPATVESWGGPAATPRAAARSGGSADCARHCGDCARLLKDLHVPDNTNRSAEEMKTLICMRSM